MTTGVRSVSFPALGGTAIVAVVDPARLDCARIAVQRTVSALDRACSRFREDSELTALGAHPGAAVRVSGLLLDAVTAALRAARLTDGDVDPTIGQALIALGYDRDFAAVSARGAAGVRAALGAQGALDGQDSGSLGGPPGGGRPVRVASVPGWQAVQVDPVAGTIRVPRGVKLDLGATGKALGADRAALAAHDAAGCGVLVGLSGDIAIEGPAPPEGWRIRVTDDHRSGVDAPGQWITLRSGGLATSSTIVRRWRVSGETVHHLLDPSNGAPAHEVWRTVSVAAASCLDANIASTAAIVRGERAADWLRSLGLPSRLVAGDGNAWHLAGWPSEGDDLRPGARPPAEEQAAADRRRA